MNNSNFNNINKLKGIFFFFLLCNYSVQSQNIALGISDVIINPNVNSLLHLDITTNDKGILIPRLSSLNRLAMSISVVDEGLTVYDTDTKSYCVWNGNEWSEFMKGDTFSNYWGLNGNNSGTNDFFIGTVDQNEFQMKIVNLSTSQYRGWMIDNEGRLIPYFGNVGPFPYDGRNSINIGETGISNEGTIYFGFRAGFNNAFGSKNICVGAFSLYNSQGSSGNIALGRYSLNATTTPPPNSFYPSYNIAIGAFSLTNTTDNIENISIGNRAMYGQNITTSNYKRRSIVIGEFAMYNYSYGEDNVVLGAESFYSASASHSTSIGYRSQYSINSTIHNVSLGTYSMEYDLNIYTSLFSRRQVSIGHASLRFVNPHSSVALGAFAGERRGGDGTVIIGASYTQPFIYSNLPKSNYSILIGSGVDSLQLYDNRLYIENQNASSPLMLGDFASDEVSINGSLGVNTMSPISELTISGTVQTDTLILTTGANLNHVLSSNGSGASSWQSISTLINDTDWTINGNDMYAAVSGNIGIGTTTPMYKLTHHGAMMLYAGQLPSNQANYAGIFADLSSGQAELIAVDEAGNNTVISPHHFSLIPKSEEMAWSYYSKNEHLGKQVNVDIMRAIRLLEKSSGERLIYQANLNGEMINQDNDYKENSIVETVLAQQKIIKSQQEKLNKLKIQIADRKERVGKLIPLIINK